MQYLCTKKFAAGGVDYHPGEPVPDGVILPERSGRLIKNGYISEIGAGRPASVHGAGKIYTQAEMDAMLDEAIEEAVNNTIAEMNQKQIGVAGAAAELIGAAPGAYEGTIAVAVNGPSYGENGQAMAVPATPEEIQRVFAIMQLNAEDGAREIANVESENVLILLHAADSRKTIKDAARKQAGNISSTQGDINEPTGCNATTGANTEGADT